MKVETEIQETQIIHITKADLILLVCRYQKISAGRLKEACVSIQGSTREFDDLEVQVRLRLLGSSKKADTEIDETEDDKSDVDLDEDDEYDDQYTW